MSEEIKTAIQFINDVVSGKYTAAKKENDFVYHEKLPALDSLPEIKGESLSLMYTLWGRSNAVEC